MAKGAGPPRHPSKSRKLTADFIAKGVQFKGGVQSEAIRRSSDADQHSYLMSIYPMPCQGTDNPKFSFFICRGDPCA